MTHEYESDQVYACTRCGQDIEGQTLQKRQSRGSSNTQCHDCNAKPALRVGKCVAWSGDVDLDTMQPLKNGEPYMPGNRSCGKADCVNKQHVELAPKTAPRKPSAPVQGDWTFAKAFQSIMASEGFDNVLSERFGITAETARTMSFADLVAVVERKGN